MRNENDGKPVTWSVMSATQRKEALLRRRERIHTVGNLALWAALGLGAGEMLPNGCETKPPPPVKLTRSGIITQAEADVEYARLYDEISQAKAKAERAGRKLAVILGERHDSCLSYLHKVIITDITAQLGIKDAIVEDPEFAAQYYRKNFSGAQKEFASGISLRVAGSSKPRFSHLLPPRDGNALLEQKLNMLSVALKDDTLSSLEGEAGTFYYSLAAGQSMHAGDNERFDKNGNQRDRSDPIVNQEMAHAASDVPLHSFSSFGLDHLSMVIDRLKLISPSTDVLAYDISNVDLRALDGADDEDPAGAVKWKPARAKLKAMVADGSVKKLTVDADEPHSAADMMTLALTASIHHAQQRGELNAVTAKDAIDSFARMRRDAAWLDKQSAGR